MSTNGGSGFSAWILGVVAAFALVLTAVWFFGRPAPAPSGQTPEVSTTALPQQTDEAADSTESATETGSLDADADTSNQLSEPTEDDAAEVGTSQDDTSSDPAMPEEDVAADAPQASDGAAESGDETAPDDTAETAQDAVTETTAEGNADGETAEVAQSNTSAFDLRLDEIRVEADGLAVIAGRAAPGREVILRADGVEVARVQAGADGAFATVAILDANAGPRVLSLSEVGPDGQERLSQDELILAPTQTASVDPTELVTAREVESDAESEVVAAAETDQAAAAETDIVATGDDPTDTTNTAEQVASDESTADTAKVTDQSPDRADDPAAPENVTSETSETPSAPATTADAPQTGVAVLRADETGVVLAQGAGPSAAQIDQVALDTIGYSALGDVQLSGRAQPDTREVRVYLDNQPVAALDVDQSGGWRGAVPDVDTGVYTLRIDEVAADGSVTSRVETPFKREDPTILAAATDAQGGKVQAVTVQKGDTLWAISRDRYGEGLLYVRVFEANRGLIRDPDLIYPGQVFTLPED